MSFFLRFLLIQRQAQENCDGLNFNEVGTEADKGQSKNIYEIRKNVFKIRKKYFKS